MRKIICLIILFICLSAIGAVAETTFSFKKSSDGNIPLVYTVTPGGAEKQLEYAIYPAEMPMREVEPLPTYWFMPVELGPDQLEGVILGDADTGRGRFIPLPGGRWCVNAHISPDGKFAALLLGKGNRMDLVFCDVEAGRSVDTLRHAYAGGWVDSGRMVVNRFEPGRTRYGEHQEEGDYSNFWWSVAVCEVSSQKIGEPWVILPATETDNYTVSGYQDGFVLQREFVSVPDGSEKYRSMKVSLNWAGAAWVPGETCGIRDKGPVSAASLDRILEPYIQKNGEELAVSTEVASVHMPLLPVPASHPEYSWFVTEPQAGEKPGIRLAIPDFGPGVFLPLDEASTCTAVWISPDEKRVLLLLEAAAALPSLGIYDIQAQRLTDVLPAAAYPSWLDADRFAFVASDPQKSPPERPENTNLWESTVLCELDESGKAKTSTLFQATEMENYF
jgi:hypothetical protein